ncbi:MAG TPA: hypothetical protein VGS19_23970 [Streptosporangiaceae bacterium]|nr:hypothetical protein [Streptosporangiaceae bacterium]
MAQDATRRTVLAVVTAALPVLASGCKGVGALGTPPKPGPEVAMARQAIAQEVLMLARYQAVITADPGAAGLLRPIAAQHGEHLARLRARLRGPHALHQSLTPPTVHAPAAVPGLTWLADAEDASARWLLSRVGAASPSFAQLLASVAASEASHALVLTQGQP